MDILITLLVVGIPIFWFIYHCEEKSRKSMYERLKLSKGPKADYCYCNFGEYGTLCEYCVEVE